MVQDAAMRTHIIAILIGALLGTATSAESIRPTTVRTGKARPDGALVCPTLAAVAFATEQLRRGSSPPDLKILRCALLPEGTSMTIEEGDRGAIVTAETMFGTVVRGVTDLTTVDVDSPGR